MNSSSELENKLLREQYRAFRETDFAKNLPPGILDAPVYGKYKYSRKHFVDWVFD